ncbi:MAG TPA: EAL domain-containing protein [Dokdonella sp.]
MLARDFDLHRPERLRLFEAQLAQRIARLCRRGERLQADRWDINTLALLAADAAFLAASCRELEAAALADDLDALHAAAAALLAPPHLPQPDQAAQIAQLISALAQRPPRKAFIDTGPVVGIVVAGATHDHGFPLLVVPPPDYWTRFGVPVVLPPPHIEQTVVADAPVVAAIERVAAPSPPVAPAAPAAAAATTVQRVYFLSDGSPFAADIEAGLHARGYATTRFDDGAELAAALGASPPALVLVDASFAAAIDDIGARLKRVRKELDQPVWLVALSGPADVAARLHAVRVGCDALIETPTSADRVIARIAELTEAARGDPYRIMIIEDDRTQTVFAESILRKAGMQTLAVGDALEALDALERFHPDLILMDLYMPGCDGIDLTALIRQREAFVATPIVFLSGEHNADKHFEALDAGGDDFLSKPVRPKHLISAVTNRVRRTRQQRRRGDAAAMPALASALTARGDLLQRVSDCLAMEDARSRAGGLLVFALEDASAQRARVDTAGAAGPIATAGALLIAHVGARDLVAADGDGRFLVFNPDCNANLLEAYALNLRDRISRESSAAASGPVVFDVGVCPFVAGASQVERMRETALNAIQTARAAGRRGVFMVRDVAATANHELVERIRVALDGDGFQLVFQPIVSLHGEEEEQFQALLRLHGSDQRVHTAAEVIPAAERAGLIGAVDRWVLQHCVELIAARPPGGQAPRLFASLSLASVRDADSVRWLGDLLVRRKASADALSLELRLLDAATDEAAVERWADAVHALGASVTLAGVESGPRAERLLRMPSISYLKVAPRYLRFDDEAIRSELRALVEVAHEHGKRVIAPRVEDARGAAALWTAGVDFIQGNFVQQAGQELVFDFHASAL